MLDVGGSVAAAFDGSAKGVRFHGVVDDLAPLYASAGIVISPLLQGSGLKIKLIEALANGKASVVTGVTLQGVEAQLRDAVVRADSAKDFADTILRLQDDPAARLALAQSALDAAEKGFGPDAAFRAFRAWLTTPRDSISLGQ